MEKQYPKAWSYLEENKKELEGREEGKMKGPTWYGYVYPKNLGLVGRPKILVRDIVDKGEFALDEKGGFVFVSGYGITLRDNAYSLKYVL